MCPRSQEEVGPAKYDECIVRGEESGSDGDIGVPSMLNEMGLPPFCLSDCSQYQDKGGLVGQGREARATLCLFAPATAVVCGSERQGPIGLCFALPGSLSSSWLALWQRRATRKAPAAFTIRLDA